MPQRNDELKQYRKTLYHKILADLKERIRPDLDKAKAAQEPGGVEGVLDRMSLEMLPASATFVKGGTRKLNSTINDTGGKGVIYEAIQVDDDGVRHYVLIVDFAQRGCPKYRYPLADLEQYL